MKYRAVLIVAVSLGLTSVAEARSQRVEQIPNGEEFSCTTCHDSSFPTGAQNGARNVFGQQVEANLTGTGGTATQEVDWQAIYDLDADGDGFTNGQELGDPNGEWSQGEDPPEDYAPSRPADAEDTPDIPTGGDDAGGDDAGTTDAGPSPDVGTDAGGDAGGDAARLDDTAQDPDEIDDGCSATGATDPASSGALIALFGLGLAALRRRFS